MHKCAQALSIQFAESELISHKVASQQRQKLAVKKVSIGLIVRVKRNQVTMHASMQTVLPIHSVIQKQAAQVAVQHQAQAAAVGEQLDLVVLVALVVQVALVDLVVLVDQGDLADLPKLQEVIKNLPSQVSLSVQMESTPVLVKKVVLL